MKSKDCPNCGEKLSIQLDEHFEEILNCPNCEYWQYTGRRLNL